MKTLLKYTILAFVVFFFSVPAEAFTKLSLKDQLSAEATHRKQATAYCFNIPYSEEELAQIDNSTLAKTLARGAQQNIPAHVLKKDFREVKFFKGENATIFACLYFEIE